VGDAELHAEVAVFRAPAAAAPDDFHPVWKVVVGGSYRFPLGSGILETTTRKAGRYVARSRNRRRAPAAR
jgi:hypothetical protein